MNGGHLQLRLGLGRVIRLVLLFGDLFLEVGIVQEQGLVWELYKSRIRGLHSQYTHSFNIIDGQ